MSVGIKLFKNEIRNYQLEIFKTRIRNQKLEIRNKE